MSVLPVVCSGPKYVEAQRWVIIQAYKNVLRYIQEGGGVRPKNWVGVNDPFRKTVTLFMTKVCDIPCPIYD